ncbi:MULTISPECIES: hypothetical protein [Mycobacterium]|nr:MULTISPECIES: hypothetical protein [Mycobacterium]UQB91243.1 hypothetical protein KN252_18640 [Mycobacterium intracellulare]WSE48070.1 hypothetical protein QGN30_09320 [Mycobacterium sp. 3-98]WVL05511.1 hypothetical protein KN247_25855 [Mycobacterium intracellulare]
MIVQVVPAVAAQPVGTSNIAANPTAATAALRVFRVGIDFMIVPFT